jgi:beta-glucosidase
MGALIDLSDLRSGVPLSSDERYTQRHKQREFLPGVGRPIGERRQQVELVNAVTAVGKPTVAVVMMARPQGLAPVIDKLPAVLTDFYGGPSQGVAIADAIFGVTNPSGKLPVTIPRHVGQVPIHHAQRWGSGYRRTKDDIHKGYLDMPSTPLFPFGQCR